MPTLRTATGKYHAPWDVTRSSIELAVDEVAEASQKQADGHGDRGEVRDGIERNPISPGKEP
jgi:hypothetical protein